MEQLSSSKLDEDLLKDVEDDDVYQSEEDEDNKRSKLLDKITSMSFDNQNRKFLPLKNEPSNRIDEFNFSRKTDEGPKLHLRDLLKSTKSSEEDIGKKLKKFKKKTAIEKPIEKHVSDQAERLANYQDTNKKISKWFPVAEFHRTAEHLEFPLKKPDYRQQSGHEIIQRFKLQSEMELKIQELLNSSENRLDDDKALTVAEEKYLKAMDLEEARARHKELLKMRALLSYHEIKLKRRAKIKSKAYHRILKKEKQREAKKRMEELAEKDPQAALEQLEEADKVRAKERASLKHRNTGKWAKFNKIRALYDEEARQSLNEQLELNRKLMEKIRQDEEDMDESDEDKVINNDGKDEEEIWPEVSMSYNPWMKSGKQRMEEEKKKDIFANVNKSEVVIEVAGGDNVKINDHLTDDELDKAKEIVKSKKNSSQENLKITNEKRKIKSDEDEDEFKDTKDKEKLKKRKNKEKKRTKLNKISSEKSSSDHTNLNNFFNSNQIQLKSSLSNILDDRSDIDSEDEEQRKLIAEAFANDDVVNEFKAEKNEIIESETIKDIDTFLPGWGSWGGAGIKINPKRKSKYVIKAKKVDRADEKLPNVIISENQDELIKKYMVKNLPFPHKNVVQFENSIRNPIGSTWVPETAFAKLIEPRIKVRGNQVIKPVDEDALITRRNKNYSHKKKEEFHQKNMIEFS